MKHYSFYGLNDFIICCGYKGHIIKEFFAKYRNNFSDFTIDFNNNSIQLLSSNSDPWRVTLIDTGLSTQTGGRIARIRDYLDDTFFLTYGDGLSDVNIKQLFEFHKSEGKQCTVTTVQPEARFGAIEMEGTSIVNFHEKPIGDNRWINGGFFVCEKSVVNLIDGDSCIWEREPLQRLSRAQQLAGFKHSGFWMPMDTMRDKNMLEELWASDKAPWRSWS